MNSRQRRKRRRADRREKLETWQHLHDRLKEPDPTPRDFYEAQAWMLRNGDGDR